MVIVSLPLFSGMSYYVLSSIYYILVLVTLIFWGIASRIDPSDPRIYGKKYNIEGTLINYCTICRSAVAHGSKHCAKCDRCVEAFDHHCEWLNNCVGKRNYHSFFIVTFSMTLTVFMKLVIAIYLVCLGLIDQNNLIIPQSFGEKNQSKYIVLIACMAAKDPFVLAILLNLLFFHIWLKAKGMTTYEYLMNKKHKRNNAGKVNISTRKTQDLKKEISILKNENKKKKNEIKPNEDSKNIPQNQKNDKNDILESDINKDNEINEIKQQKSKSTIIDKIIIEEADMNFTKESVRIGDKMESLIMSQFDEVKIKKPGDGSAKIKESQRSGELGLTDEESLNLSGK